MEKNNLPGLSPLWLISLGFILGCVIVVMIPASIATGDAIKSSDWIGFAGNVVAGAMTLIAATFAWFAVKRQIDAQTQAEATKRELQKTDLARILYAELTHLVARCCFDSERPWKAFWQGSVRPDEMDVARLRRFTPSVPVIYLATAEQLALLGSAAQVLMEFHYRLSALRREIENFTDGASTKLIEVKAVQLVGLRFRQTLRPGLKALESLAPLVHDPESIEALARALYYEARPEEDRNKTLRQRIIELAA
jgi:hypothetical protein